MQPLVSIIIPTYNRSELLGTTLDSIINQTYENWECIVVDDGSTDFTGELMAFYKEKDNRISFHSRPIDRAKGVSICRNFGFELSKGEYINWFDSDDLMRQDFLSKKLEILESTKSFCCISRARIFHINNGQMEFGAITNIRYTSLMRELIQEKIGIGTTNPMWKREFLKQFKLFDEELHHSEDLEFHSRIFSKYDKIQAVDEVLMYIRAGHSSISKDFYRRFPVSLNSYLKARKRIISNTKRDLEINKIIIRQSLDMFRYLLGVKDFKACETILKFIGEHSAHTSLKHKLAYKRLLFFYYLFKLCGRGETRFKKTLYLP